MAWPLAAMGIGALLGGMGAKQRGGNFLKGALTGAALGGVTGYLGGTYGKFGGTGGEGGIFGLGKKMLPNFLAMELKCLDSRRRIKKHWKEEDDCLMKRKIKELED